MKENNKALLYAFIAILSWSTVASAFKIALRSLTFYELLLVATLTALVIFSLTITLQSKWPLLKELTLKKWGTFAFIGLLNPTIYYLVLFKAYNLLPAQIAQPINFFWPILLSLLLAVFAHQPIPKVKYIGMAISFAGVTLISMGSQSFSGIKLSVWGLILAFFSAFFWAIFWMVNNKNKDTDNVVSLFASFLFGAVYLLIGAIFMSVDLSSVRGVLSGVYVGTFEMGIPFIFFGLALKNSKNPALTNHLCYLSPFISLFIIHWVLGEKIYPTTYTGLLLIVGGIIFNEYLIKKKQNSQ